MNEPVVFAENLKWRCGMCGANGDTRESFDTHVNDHAAVAVAGVIADGMTITATCDPRTHLCDTPTSPA